MSDVRAGSTPLALRIRRAARGFTLIELTVSLVAGLIVAMAVAVLSHEASATFNEEVRVSAAEATIRGAADRLRSDLQRVSYMSTPNIQVDPNIAKLFGQAGNVPSGSPLALQTLQGIRLYAGSSTINSNNGLALDTTPNNVTPSYVDMTGNFSSADQFEVQSVLLTGGCCKISLVASSPAIYRMLNANDAGKPDPNADSEMQAIFAPAPPVGSATLTSRQFYVRYVDTATNHSQFLLTCSNGGGQIAGIPVSGNVIQPYVLTQTCPLTGAQTGTLTATNGNTAGLATINPVQTVRWEVVGTASKGTAVPAQDVNALDNQAMEGGADTNKYDLVRSLVNVTDVNLAVLPETTEIIAEYAVDLELAFTVDTGDTTGASPKLVSYDFGDANNQLVGDIKTTNPVNGPSNPDPQRIRSVRFLLSTRAALPDRNASIAVPASGSGTFLYRYCMTPTGCTGTSLLQWARVRTLVGEVALTNQQQAFF
jgi:prepilin-type N-terminal cleavage/methylation domain-containing protein